MSGLFFVHLRRSLRGGTADDDVVVAVEVAVGIALLDLVVRAFCQLDDADVDALVVAAVGEVLATLVHLGVDGHVSAAGVIVLELVVHTEVILRFGARPYAAQRQPLALDVALVLPGKRLLPAAASSSSTPAESSFRCLLLDNLPLLEVGLAHVQPLLALVGVPIPALQLLEGHKVVQLVLRGVDLHIDWVSARCT